MEPNRKVINKISEIKKLESLLPKAMHGDMHSLRLKIKQLKQLTTKEKKGGKPTDKDIEKKLKYLEKKLKTSVRKKERRKQNLPKLSYNRSLPITARKRDIIDAISKNSVVIISGETGSGKTTQIPKFCIAAKRGVDGIIGCTQPRRIAAITVANRIAEELGENLGQSVGYKIRFQDRTGDEPYIKIMTDGILLAETQGDPYLNMYDTLIIDEAHERSLNIDFVLGILKTLLKKRGDLKLIITSATIDTKKFSKAFDNAPVIEVSGRTFPVETQYFPINNKKYEDKTHVDLAAIAIDKILMESVSGDILVFMPTEQDIRETRELIKGRNHRWITVMPLFARLAANQQSKVYSQISGRKIIVATNIAETSLTIPGIKYVVDTGLARISQYLPRSGTTSLPVIPISQSSADQRKGRCGRVENGVCVRLYEQEDYNNRPIFTLPEILRANLAEVILRMISLKLGDISDFPFIDKPFAKSIKDGFDTLLELGAIIVRPKSRSLKNRFVLTENGRLMAKLPVDPRLSRILIQAKKEKCLKEAVIITSALSIQDPRERPSENAQEADQAHAKFVDISSDFITFLNIWNIYSGISKNAKSRNQVRQFCKTNFLSFKRMKEWYDIHGQIIVTLKEYGFKINKTEYDKTVDNESFTPFYTALHKSILSGYLSNIAVKKEKNIFNAAKAREVMIFPGSGLFNRAKAWVVAAEIVETSRLFARTTANIDSSWIEELGSGLCKHTYLDPHWEKKKGQVVASCQTSLFGLIIPPLKSVPYGNVNPDEACEIFIRKALVQGDVNRPWFNRTFPFMAHNEELIEEIKSVEDRVRKRDILISDEDMFEFYHKRLENIYDIKSFQELIKKRKDDRFLRMSEKDLLKYLPDQDEVALFPDKISLGNMEFDCDYRFKPGKKDDGVTVKIPSSMASSVPPGATEWLVPGLYREKLTTLIKGLPKEYRKKLVPTAQTVEKLIKEMPKTPNSMVTTMGEFIFNRFKVDIPASAWPDKDLPDHLKMRVAITDPGGKKLRCSRDKSILKKDLPETANWEAKQSDEFDPAKKKWEKSCLTGWDFPDIPEEILLTGKANAKCTFYPGLEPDKKDSKTVNLKLFRSKDRAATSHKKGIAALYGLIFASELKFLKKNLRLSKEVVNYAKHFGGTKMFETRLYDKVTTDLFSINIKTKNEFDSHAEKTAPVIQKKGLDLLKKTETVLKTYHETRAILHNLNMANKVNQTATMFLDDLGKQLERVVPETFAALYHTSRLDHIVRYIKAISIRAQRSMSDFRKDQDRAIELEKFNNNLNELVKGITIRTSEEKREAIEEFFWLIEEYKVSIFAQELKTPFPVSKKRLDKKLNEIKRMV